MTKSNKTKKKLKTNNKTRTSKDSSSSSVERKEKIKSKTEKKVKKNITQQKKRLFIIESDSSSSSPEKIEKVFSEFIPDKPKIDLKISQDISKMLEPVITGKQLVNGRLNEKFIDLMEKLADIMLKKGEPFRARAYQKAQETMMAYTDDILTPDDLNGKPGIGPTIMEKLNEYVQTGTLKILEREKNNPVNILAEVYGIGPKKAKDLVDEGITSIDQLRQKQHMLNDIQKVGLQYYEDVLKKVPRTEIEEYKSVFEKALPKKSDAKMEIVGSYRRGAQASGDIDVIITSDSPKVFTSFVDNLVEEKVILYILSRGPTKCLVMAKIPSSSVARRVDFLYTGKTEFPFAILYFTGSKIFNTVMRHVALEKGYTMNEHGIYKLENKKKGNKVDRIFTTEKDIFDFLGLQYKAPQERTDGRAVIPLGKTGFIIDSSTSPSASASSSLPSDNGTHNKVVVKQAFIIESDTDGEDEEDGEEKAPKISDKIKTIVNDFKSNGISVLYKLNEKELTELLRETNVAYRNQQPIITDNQFDIIQEYIEAKYPSNSAVKEIGAPIERNKAVLPYTMGSMDKIKPDTGALPSWSAKYSGPYVLSAKLDGVSGLYTTEGAEPKLYTRGDGRIGQDVSHLIPYLRLPKSKGIVIRGEFIIPKNLFDAKYKAKFANPRNMVSGIVNHKTINEAVKDLHFLAYEVIKPSLKPSEQIVFLATLDVEVVLNMMENKLSNNLLSKILVDWRSNYAYEIDGVIVVNDAIYQRKFGNPDHAFAFKMVLSDQIAEAKVIDVLWGASKDGYLKPRVQIEPIHLSGVTIEYATGFNGAFIHDNKIGVGAVIELIRSGDVIPYIRKVIVPSDQPRMPSVPFKWNNTHVDIMLEDIESDATVKEKNITGFFRGIGVEGLSSGNVKRIMEAGFDSVQAILKMSVADFLKVDGFKEKTANKLHNGIATAVDSASLVSIMAASNMFGRGFSEKRLELVMEAEPKILLLQESVSHKVGKVAAIKGMATKSAEAFVERIPDFIQFMKSAGLVKKLASNEASIKKAFNESHPLYGKSIVMTGFRDTDLQDNLKELGVKLGSSVSSKTFVVLAKDKDEDTGKAAEARKLGIPIMTPQEFRMKFL
jgi:NAD-dependent DNA ligase/DNA polymerase/3'-5' exonuclease PolX